MHYNANSLICTFQNPRGNQVSILFQVSNNNIAFRYELPEWGERKACVIERKATGFKFPQSTTTFLSYMMSPMQTLVLHRVTKVVTNDEQVGKPTHENQGYVFPGLFRINDAGWVLVSEAGITVCIVHRI